MSAIPGLLSLVLLKLPKLKTHRLSGNWTPSFCLLGSLSLLIWRIPFVVTWWICISTLLHWFLMCEFVRIETMKSRTSNWPMGATSCTILLHEPHADVRNSGSLSALRILNAARDILDLIYALQSTSYDITLVDLACSVKSRICMCHAYGPNVWA